jgi:uncharacterized protein (TIGR01777 family)
MRAMRVIRAPDKNKMRVLISGSSGMVGTAVSRLLAENGYTVSRLIRHKSAAKIVVTPPAEKPVESQAEDKTQNEVPSETQDTVENEIENEIENEVQSEGQAEPLTDFPNEALSESESEVQSEAQADALDEVQEEVQNVVEAEIPIQLPVSNDVRWDPVANEFDAAAADGVDAVVHLAGASIGGGRWTTARKALLRSSRVEATRHLVDSLSALNAKPKIFIGVSAVGYYGDRGDEKLTDHSGPGSDFLAQICKDWERESSRAAEFGARVAILRFGIILSTRGGALPKMLTPIKMFVGGKLGSGQQWMSWISLDDAAGVIRFALENETARGPINTVSPYPIRNVDFTKKAARAVHRPALFPAPAFALRLMLGEMADGLLLSSQRALPEKLKTLGYQFQDGDLGFTLARLISEKK